jgi:hypothetical protein
MEMQINVLTERDKKELKGLLENGWVIKSHFYSSTFSIFSDSIDYILEK